MCAPDRESFGVEEVLAAADACACNGKCAGLSDIPQRWTEPKPDHD